MKKILISILTVGVVAGAVFGASTAFFSDTETSTGNTLAAGAIDLKIDNICYYNDQACVDTNEGSFWDGDRTKGECSCNWELSDLDKHLFFELSDLKPGDWEEDTISLHVDSNDAWVCANVMLTSDEDNTCTEPELGDDPTCPSPSPLPGSGDLADEIRFIWWADDGDNVLEEDEKTLPAGAIGNLGIGQTARVTLVDSQSSIWDPGPNPSPFPGGEDRFIGKGWCFGDIGRAPVADKDEAGNDVNTGPDVRGGGFTCNGEPVNNASQTDSLTMDIGFEAVQARHNDDFLCNPPVSPSPSPSPGE